MPFGSVPYRFTIGMHEDHVGRRFSLSMRPMRVDESDLLENDVLKHEKTPPSPLRTRVVLVGGPPVCPVWLSTSKGSLALLGLGLDCARRPADGRQHGLPAPVYGDRAAQ